ncbi:MAG: hypothetical protein M1832_005445 [Thelocarpon impressellum]|nr:MAG: hypothetical protein M1832_005445 [Thelocarpon impressellum]
MSEPIPESIPTSADPRSKRPTKKRALTPTTLQASQVSSLFAHPEREITIPSSTNLTTTFRGIPPPPEIVANVQGSSAGAGSGEFHVYKASRRREYERLRRMDEEIKEESEAREFEEKKEELRRRDEAKTARNKARREKMKARKQKGRGKGGEGMDVDGAGGGAVVTENGSYGRTGLSSGAVTEHDPGDLPDAPVAQEAGVIIHDDD